MQPKPRKPDTLILPSVPADIPDPPVPDGPVDPPGASVPGYITNPDGTVTPSLRWVKISDGTVTPFSGWTVPTTRTPLRGARGRRRTRWMRIGYAIRVYLEAHPQERDRLAQKYGWVD